VKFSIGNRELYNFQIKHSKFVGITTLLSRTYPGIFDQYFEIHETEFAKRLNINKTELLNQLKELEKYGICDVSWSSSLPSVTLTHERLPDDYLSLSPEVYQTRKDNASTKLEAALNFLRVDDCRSVQLLRYFGQDSKECGKCDVCQKKNRKDYQLAELKALLQGYLKTEHSFEDCLAFTFAQNEQLKLALKELMLDEKVLFNGSVYQAR
jgi:ATP-dependent DNA helicase RecQ